MTGDVSPLAIGEVARRLGVSISKIRFLEGRGLVAPSRRPSGYRVYDEDDVVTLRVVLLAQSLGFSLVEIRDTLRQRTLDGLRTGFVADRFEEKAAEIDRKAMELAAMRSRLVGAIAELRSGHTAVLR